MHKAVSIGLAAAGISLNSTSAASFDDIQFWVGSGVNQAALVIDWNDGKAEESLLWGFRWDGAATGLDMLQSVVSADPRLFAHVGDFGWGKAILGIGYDLNGNDVFGVSPALAFDDTGFFFTGTPNPDDSRSPVDSPDHYVEGWNFGFWGYTVKDSGQAPWAEATVGAADRLLNSGVWDGFSFAPDFVSSSPSEPVAAVPVPEPTTGTLVGLSAIFLACVRRAHS